MFLLLPLILLRLLVKQIQVFGREHSANISNNSGTGALDLTSSANFGKVKFAISVDGGASVQVDLRDKLLSTSGVDSSSVTQTQVVTALMQSWKDYLMQE